MRKWLTMMICVLIASVAFGQWETNYGPVDHFSPACAAAFDATTVVAMDDNIVMKTTDFGVNWSEIVLPEVFSVQAVDALNDTVAFACGDDGFVYKTSDAGETWAQVGDTVLNTIDLHVIDVVDADNIFIGGEDGLFMKTSDGGASWDTSLVATTTEDLDGGIAFTTALNGIIFGDGSVGEVWSTTDGGSSWTVFNLVPPLGLTYKRAYGASCVPGTQNFTLVGYHNTTWKSTDGGATFAVVGDYSYGYDQNKFVQMFDADNWIVITSQNGLLTTSDAGATWDTTSIGTGQSFGAAAFSSMTNGIVLATYGQWKATTDGSTFTNVYDWPAISFWGLGFPEPGTVMLGAWGGGEIAKSTDGGSTFSYPDNYASKTDDHIYELEFLDANTGLFAGTAGMIKKTVDGGTTWNTIDNPMMYESNHHINAMHVTADGTVYVGGSKGDIMKSTDDGDTWTPIENEATQTVYDIHVFDDGQIMAVMGSGQFALLNAATDTFEMVADYGSMSLRSITEANGVVLVAGSKDWIWRTTTDALDTMVAVFNEPSSEPFYDVVFTDDLTAYAVADGGHIHKSVDAGLTWTEEMTGLGDYTLDKIGTNGDKVFVLGKAGVVMSHSLTTVQADFTEEFTDGTADLTWVENTTNGNAGGLNLTVAADSAGLTNVGIYVDDAYTGLLYADTGKKLKDYEVSADIYCVQPQSNTEPTYKGISVKVDPVSTRFYRFVYRNSSSSNGALKFQGYDGESWYATTQWNAGVDFDTLATGFHNLKATVIDNKFWLYIDGTLLPGCPISHDGEPVVSAGYPGLYVYGGNVEFDNFKVNVFEYPKYNITANVDMGIMVRRGEFVPASSALDIIGTFDGWTGTAMTDANADTIYTASLGAIEAGTTVEFKCRRNGAWDNTEEFPSGGANRTYLVTDDGDQTIPTFLYGDVTEVATANVPNSYELSQNYPNPFNPSTTINFQIPNSEIVTINIFDLNGRKVAQLFNAQMDAGSYNVAFDASSLPSGMYVYRLTAGTFSDVKKMTLLK